MDASPRLLYRVKQLELAVRARLDVMLKPHRITVTQYTALTVLELHPGMSGAQLARHTFVSAQAMDGIVRALEEAGLIARTRDPDNRRRMTIALTDRAKDLLATCRTEVDEIEAEAFRGLSARERDELERWLGDARHALEDSSRHVD